MANVKRSWKEVFTENYLGKSDLAKEVEPFLKDNYKGNAYIPWATMERLTYMCDEDAIFENIKNANGGLVHTDVMEMHQQNIQKGEIVSETVSQMFSHMVKVKLVFMGKEFIEEYPIQDQDYSAAKVFNQNLVNRALQRAKAKVASRATGIGYKLYEGKDLQFDEIPQDVKPQIPVVNEQNAPVEEKKAPKTTKNAQNSEKTVQKVEEKPVTPQPVVEENKIDENVEQQMTLADGSEHTKNDPVSEAVNLIKNTEVAKMNLALQRVNVALMKKHKIALSTESSEEELRNILANKTIFSNPEQFLKTLKTLLGM